MRRAKGLIVAIDGPSGAGKSTVGRALADALRYTYLDTGAMYRAFAVKALELGIALDDEAALAASAAHTKIAFDETGKHVLLDGRDVTDAIRSREATRAASAVARLSGVRREMVRRQQELGEQGGVVLDGRDIGTVVFKDAEAKFYLDAAAEKRAQRRVDEIRAKGLDADYDTVLAEIRARDHQDMNRTDSPLAQSIDAVYIDTTELTTGQVIDRLAALTRERMPRS
jgi:cytidylate kinase